MGLWWVLNELPPCNASGAGCPEAAARPALPVRKRQELEATAASMPAADLQMDAAMGLARASATGENPPKGLKVPVCVAMHMAFL